MSGKKPGFRIYQSKYDRYYRQCAGKTAKKGKKITKAEYYKGIVHQLDEMYANTIESIPFKILAHEHFWKQSGKNAIFPESADMAMRLVNGKFDCNKSSIINFPMESFLLATPKNFVVDGIAIPSCIVSVISAHDYAEKIVNPYCDYVGRERPEWCVVREVANETSMISVAYSLPSEPERTSIIWVYSIDLPDILASKNYREYYKLLEKKHADEEILMLDNTSEDSIIQFTLLKLLAGFGVFNAATEGEYFKPGLPGKNTVIDVDSEDRPQNIFSFGDSSKPLLVNNTSPDGHYRTWFFRNLQDQRYYKGDHKDKEIGSRWVFVSDTLVNSDLKSHTIVGDK